jgi:hypothetical protein
MKNIWFIIISTSHIDTKASSVRITIFFMKQHSIDCIACSPKFCSNVEKLETIIRLAMPHISVESYFVHIIS